VLDTQDFYEGLLNDIQPSLIAYYLQSTLPRDLLFNLVVERIVVSVNGCTPIHSGGCERDFRNNPDSPLAPGEDIALFQTFAAFVLSLNPSVEQIAAKKAPQTSNPFYSRQAGFVADERGVML